MPLWKVAGVPALGLMAIASLHAQSASDAANCAGMPGAALPGVRIESASWIQPQSGWSPAERTRPVDIKEPFCRLSGVIEKEIGFELWLPAASAWNRKFLGAGVGGDAGTFNFNDLPRGVQRGYASATTDTGHKAADLNWMLGDPARLANYELRAHHLLAETSKALIGKFYAKPPAHSYFIGCSGGGRQGLKEMQRFPLDYDGIIAGAPGPKTPEMTARRMWELTLRDANNGLMSPADWKLIADTGVKDCDGIDGVADGVAEDPRACRFDLATLQCKGNQTQGCLSAAQLQFAKKLYDPLRDARGRAIDDGLLPGVLVDSGRSRLAPATFGQAIRHLADWNGKDFDITSDLAAIDKAMPELRADDANLSAFRAAKGKAILYQGWMDPAVAAKMTIGYYEDVRKKTDGADEFLRLFLEPGMLHCGGGAGPDQFGGSGADAPVVDADHDMLSALEKWVENGTAPERIVASKVAAGKVMRTRPLCAFPKMAQYKGTGSTDDAANFACMRQ